MPLTFLFAFFGSAFVPLLWICFRCGQYHMVHQSECNTRFCPPSEIQVITHIKRIPLLKLPSFLHQKNITESLTINQIAEVTLSSRSTVIKYLNAAQIVTRDEDHRCGGGT
jgi:hypothetical protein